MSDFIVKDSGKRQEFSLGAVRDANEGKSRIDLLSPFALERIGQHMRKGAVKYSEWNWAMGIPSSRFFESLMRHLNSYAKGDCSEDHLSAAVFNLIGLIHNEEVCGKNVVMFTPEGGKILPTSLLNYPKFYTEVTEESVTLPQETSEK